MMADIAACHEVISNWFHEHDTMFSDIPTHQIWIE